MIGKGYLSILFMMTTIVVLSNFIANAQTVPSSPTIPSNTTNLMSDAGNATARRTPSLPCAAARTTPRRPSGTQ